MPNYITMPKLADTMTEGTLVKWRKQEGDKVEVGDIVAEVETDKATMEMESFDDGILSKHLIKIGDKVPIGTKLALLLEEGEAAPAAEPEPEKKAATKAEVEPESAGKKSEKETATATAASKSSSTAVARPPGERVKSSPLARKIAAERGVDIASLQGTGPGGRIVAKDVSGAQKNGKPSSSPSAAGTSVATVPSTPAGPNDQTIPLSGMRRIIAERLLASKTQLPHFYLHIEIDAAPLMKLRAQLNAASEAAGGPKLTVNDFILKAVVTAAVKVPAVNASFAGDSIIQYSAVNLSVAVAVDEGLVTPVIRDAQKKSIGQISEAVKDLAGRARGKKLKPDEFQGGTITVSNLGAYGIEFFDAIINPPQALIVSVGAIIKKPVVDAKDQIVVGQRMGIGLSADHRVVDGAVGAQYLAELRRLLESPTLMLI
jgi:pyruvate dehydrogenase E2 component (dihydrolipoamide acetyltransferase)